MTVFDERLGCIEEGGVTFPALTVNGKPYERYMSTLNIGGGYFVALDTWGVPDESVLEDLKARIAPKAKKGKHDDKTEAVASSAEPFDSSEVGNTP